MRKINVAVLFGGCSPEYSVSLQSASAVIGQMDRNRFKPILIGISKEGDVYKRQFFNLEPAGSDRLSGSVSDLSTRQRVCQSLVFQGASNDLS